MDGVSPARHRVKSIGSLSSECCGYIAPGVPGAAGHKSPSLADRASRNSLVDCWPKASGFKASFSPMHF